MPSWERSPSLIVKGVVILFILALCQRLVVNRGMTNLAWLYLARHLHTPYSVDDSALLNAECLFQEVVRRNRAASLAHQGLGLALLNLGRETEATTAWRAVNGMAEILSQRAERALRIKEYEEALAWCERAIAVDPGLGDSWYFAALAHEGLHQWDQAREGYERAIRADAFRRVGRSSPHYRLGRIYQWEFQAPMLGMALRFYHTAIALQDFTTDSEAADAYHRRGEIYDRQGRSPQESVREYQLALAEDPGHHWARLRLGRGLYSISGDLSVALDEIHEALALWPDDESRKWPYRVLGSIYVDAGFTDEAIAAYREALHVDPDDTWVERALRDLTESSDD